MKARTVALVLLLALPGAAALAAHQPGPSAPMAVSSEGAPQAGPRCSATGPEYSCTFYYNTTTDSSTTAQEATAGSGPHVVFEIPSFPKTLATITVVLHGQDNGWATEVKQRYEFHSPTQNATHNQTISQTRHTPDGENYVTRETTTHVFDSFKAADYAVSMPGGVMSQSYTTFLDFHPSSGRLGVPGSVGPSTLSAGSFEIFYLAQEVPAGVVPDRPAATRADPQLVGHAHDADRPDMDLTEAWLDDAKLGDGLMDVHLAVAGDLDHLEWNGTNTPFATPAGGGSFQTQEKHWVLHFQVDGVPYYVQWLAYRPGDTTRSAASIQCGLYKSTNPSGPSLTTDPLLSVPACYHTNDSLLAEFPEQSIGNPGPGVRFEALSANADEIFSGYTSVVDRLGPAAFPFALGGPAYWDPLNSCRFCPPHLAWWQDPLASDNLPNTIQVGGGAIAVIGFFAGIILYRRRRAKVRELLREIERAETTHERDTRAALLALGALDSRFANMYHKGELNDDQYQVVAQRLATAATRFALRQGLGLDDGAAGDRSLPGADAAADASGVPRDRDAARTIPVQGEPRSEVRRS